jgi:hypothetical protein
MITTEQLQELVARNRSVLSGLKWRLFSSTEINAHLGSFSLYLSDTGKLQVRNVDVLAELDVPELAELFDRERKRLQTEALQEFAGHFGADASVKEVD